MGGLLLALMVAVLVALGVAQADFDPALYAPPVPEPAASRAAKEGAPAPFEGLAPQAWREVGAPESYTPSTLFEKIDGAADLYLSAGFRSLACRRYASADGAHTFQACLYLMNDAEGAWSVFSRQRRADARPLDLGRAAYRTSNALFLVHGTAYLEMIGADDAPETGSAVAAFAGAWAAAAGPAEAARVGPPFPVQGLDVDSVRRLGDGAFGFAGLDAVTVGTYALDGVRATAFWSERATPAEATALASAYVAYLLANGATRAAIEIGEPGAAALDVLGTTEVVVAVGRVLLGVHEADTQAVAATLARALVAAVPLELEEHP